MSLPAGPVAGDTQSPKLERQRATLTAKAAGKRLGLTTADIGRMLTAGQLAGYWTPGKTGRPVAMVYEDAVAELARRMNGMTP